MALNGMGLGLTFTGQDRLSPVLKGVTNQMNTTRDASGRLRDSMGKFVKGGGGGAGGGGVFGQVGGQAQAAGLALSGGFAYGLNEVTQESKAFEKEMAKISTVVDETAFSTDDARKASMKLAEEYGGRAVDQGASLYETFSAGVTNAADALALMDTANRFAVGGTADLVKSVDVLTSAVNIYGEQGLTAAHASDVMFTAIAAGKTTAGELSQYLGEVAPTAAAAGVSFDELNASIAAMTVQGIRTPQAVTGLNAMLSNMQKPAKDAADEAKRLGIEFNATALKTMGLEGVLGQLEGNAKVNDETFVKLFGSIDGVKAALALTSNGGAKFKDILKQMEGATGATDKAFDKMSNTQDFVDKQWEGMKSNAMILIGDALLPLKKDLVDLGKRAIKAWNDLPQGLRDTAVRVAAVVASVGAAGAAFSALGGGIASAFGPALKVVMMFGASGLAIFAGLALGAAALKYAYDHNLGGITETIDAALSWVKTAYQAAVQLFTTGGLEGALAESFVRGESSAVQFAVDLWVLVQRIINFFKGVGEGWSETMTELQPVFDDFVGAVEGLASAFGMIGGEDPAAQFDAMGDAGKTVGKVFGAIAGSMVSVWTVLAQIGKGFLLAWTSIGPALDSAGEGLGQIKSEFSELAGIITGGSTQTTSFGEKMVWLGTMIGKAFAIAVEATGNGFKAIGRVINAISGIVKGVVNVVGGIMNGDWARVWAGAKGIVMSFVVAVWDVIFAMGRGIAATLDALGKSLGKDLGITAKFDDMASKQMAKLEAKQEEWSAVPAQEDFKGTMQQQAQETIAQDLSGLDAATGGGGSDQAAAAAGAAAKAAMAGLPPVAATVMMTVDGAVLGEIVVNAQLAAKGREPAVVPVTPG